LKLHPIKHPPGEAFIGDEPEWTVGCVLQGSEYKMRMVRAFNWYTYCGDPKHYRKFLEEWVQYTHTGTKQKEMLKRVGQIADKHLLATVPSLARMILRGFPATDVDRERVDLFIVEKSAIGRSTDTTTPRRSVHDHVREQTLPYLHDLEDFSDFCLTTQKRNIPPTAMRPLTDQQRTPHLNILRKFVERHLSEWREVMTGQDEQLTQAYRGVPRSRIKILITRFEEVLQALVGQAKTLPKKVRTKKPTDKRKLLKKVKYLPSYPPLNLTSEGLMDLFDCQSVWVFDTKTRKLGNYVAEEGGRMYVSGTSLKGWDPTLSTQKTLRQEEEQIKQFTKLRKNQLGKWFRAVRSKALPLTGRLNMNTVILRVYS
jgi:hypothetical protein